MTILEALLLGMLQGLTEFLPVSSSGHLALAEHFLRIDSPGVTFEVFVHFGTALAVVWYFRRRVGAIIAAAVAFVLRREYDEADARLALHLAVGTVPAGLAGLLLEERLESAFSSPLLVSFLLIVTGVILWSTRNLAREGRPRETMRDAVVIGLAQAAAVFPGISRSGSTISAGLLLRLGRARAAEFAFLLSIPVILGATAASAGEALGAGSGFGLAIAVGTAAAFASALPAIALLLRLITAGRFHRFAYYCWAVGLLGITASLLAG